MTKEIVQIVRVSVRYGGGTNLATAGKGPKSARGSSTSEPRWAAVRAAAKYLGCAGDDPALELKLVQKGDLYWGETEIYEAVYTPPSST